MLLSVTEQTAITVLLSFVHTSSEETISQQFNTQIDCFTLFSVAQSVNHCWFLQKCPHPLSEFCTVSYITAKFHQIQFGCGMALLHTGGLAQI